MQPRIGVLALAGLVALAAQPVAAQETADARWQAFAGCWAPFTEDGAEPVSEHIVCFSPTAALDWPCDEKLLRFHIRQLPNGRVSGALGRTIRPGHRVRLDGPFGSAYLRPFGESRLVLVAGGTGFAPVWSIAEAAIRTQPRRELVLIAGARTLRSLYMVPALCRLALFPNVTIIPIVLDIAAPSAAIRAGNPTDHLPALKPHDVVFAAGAPEMVRVISRIAAGAGARCYSDPFEPGTRSDSVDLWSRAAEWLNSKSVFGSITGTLNSRLNFRMRHAHTV